MGTPMFVPYDGAMISTLSDLGKELLQWERKPDYDPAKNPYPKMLYRAKHRPDGKRSVHEVLDSVCGGHPGAAEQWSRGCQLTVRDDQERQRAYEQGWRDKPWEAMDLLEARDNEEGKRTAERHASDARMSELARREADAADHTTLRQLPEIKEQRVRRKPGPKPKIVASE